MTEENFTAKGNIAKVDESLGLVFGYAIICKNDGTDYFDVQGDHIPQDAMLKAAVDFMAGERSVCDMHERDDNGKVVKEGGSVLFAFPLTEEIAKAFGIDTKTYGLMIAMKPASQDMLSKFKDGTYTGFSIGGRRVKDEVLS